MVALVNEEGALEEEGSEDDEEEEEDELLEEELEEGVSPELVPQMAATASG